MTKRQAGALCAALLVGLLLFGAVYAYVGRLPDRIEACGRTYGHKDGATGAGPFTRSAMLSENPDVRFVRHLRRERELWASPQCGLGVFVRTDDDRFFGYGLLGGP